MSSTPVPTALLPRPEVGPPEPWTFPPAQRDTLPNGLEVLRYDIPGQYVASVRLAIPLPLAAEPPELEGIGTIMARTLDEGTARHSAEEFAELLEHQGIALGAGMVESGLIVEMDVARRHLGAAMDLFSQAVREPAFPAGEVARQIRSRVADIEQERANAAHRAALEFIGTYFAPSERASRPRAGTRATVCAITREDLVDFHASHVVPRGATLVVAGDLSDVDVLGEVERALGGWEGRPSGEAVDRDVAVRDGEATRIVFVDRPGSVQTELYLGCAGPDRRAEGGWAAYQVLGFVVGGSPSARIDAVLREDKGFTYGIRSGFRPRRRGGVFLTSGSVRGDSTAEALGLLLDILDTARDGFTESEARSGVDFIGRTAPGRYATADAVADEAVSLAFDGLGTEFTTRTLRDLADVDAARLTQAYRRHVDGRWTAVLVGDASAYADGVRALGRGEVTVVPA